MSLELSMDSPIPPLVYNQVILYKLVSLILNYILFIDTSAFEITGGVSAND